MPQPPATTVRRDGGDRDAWSGSLPASGGRIAPPGLDLRDRHAAGEISTHGLAVARGRLENQLSDLAFPPKSNAANERLAQHLWNHRGEWFTFLHQPGLDATNWRAELAIRFGVILRKVWGGSRTWVGAGASGADVGVANLLATRALGPGFPQSTPAGHANGPGHAPVTHRAKPVHPPAASFSALRLSARHRTYQDNGTACPHA